MFICFGFFNFLILFLLVYNILTRAMPICLITHTHLSCSCQGAAETLPLSTSAK